MRYLAVFFGAVILASCVATHDDKVLEQSNNLSLGMNKSEVLAVMGKPKATRAIDNTEYLTYFWDGDCTFFNRYGACLKYRPNVFVLRLVDGRLNAYGDPGDFDISKDPAVDIDLDIEQKSSPSQ